MLKMWQDNKAQDSVKQAHVYENMFGFVKHIKRYGSCLESL